jgi:hypothetical protein
MPLKITALCLLLLVPLSAHAAPPEVDSRLTILEAVRVSEHHDPVNGHGLKLAFKPLRPNRALARFSLEEARMVVSALEAEFKVARTRSSQSPSTGLSRRWASGSLLLPTTKATPSDLEERVREQYEALLGPSEMPLPTSLESARWFQALKLSPPYMAEGVREAAVEMFSSPAVLLSVSVSMLIYAMAWAAPEPVFSKGLAAAITLGLLMTYTAAELYTVGMACLNLYREAEAATTPAQLEAAARRFGEAIGGVGLRVLVTVAGAKLSRSLPEVPKGGMWAQLSPPRFAFAGGRMRKPFTVGSGTRAQVSVADGTVVLMGVSATTMAHAVASSVAASRTTGDCRDAANKGDAKGHHLATNKNEKSDNNGGPWTPRFRDLFARAGMSLDDPANIVYLLGHVGPHPEEYHAEVLDRIQEALGGCQTQAACRKRLIKALDLIAKEICTPGSKLHKLATRKP